MKPYLFLDIETTGLNPYDDAILEIACVLTDDRFNELSRYQAVIAVAHLEAFRDCASESVQIMHTRNGLWDAAEKSTTLISEVERTIVGMIGNHDPVLAGRSVHFDRSFLEVDMPLIVENISHRHLDLSSIAMAMDWGPRVHRAFDSKHRAMADVEFDLDYARRVRARLEGMRC